MSALLQFHPSWKDIPPWCPFWWQQRCLRKHGCGMLASIIQLWSRWCVMHHVTRWRGCSWMGWEIPSRALPSHQDGETVEVLPPDLCVFTYSQDAQNQNNSQNQVPCYFLLHEIILHENFLHSPIVSCILSLHPPLLSRHFASDTLLFQRCIFFSTWYLEQPWTTHFFCWLELDWQNYTCVAIWAALFNIHRQTCGWCDVVYRTHII